MDFVSRRSHYTLILIPSCILGVQFHCEACSDADHGKQALIVAQVGCAAIKRLTILCRW